MKLPFVTCEELNRILSSKDIEGWKETYNQHMSIFQKLDYTNTFSCVVCAMYEKLNEHIEKITKLDIDSSEYRRLSYVSLIQLDTKEINGVHKMFIKNKTKDSLIQFFNYFGYKTYISNQFGGHGHLISIHFKHLTDDDHDYINEDLDYINEVINKIGEKTFLHQL